ncbi:hypothetical protein BACCOP_00106 [Phocaeicola coprocola DSM 17136]|uniref:Uncharacterized protein n=1 Tax=Phocaeicola coprocola DSM 17136 TaxID=470145 RepID=B3JE17_9BACT|nr:hypothetical protein BACCOP_00106 [Phocaeicola coprocola DSM 17136]
MFFFLHGYITLIFSQIFTENIFWSFSRCLIFCSKSERVFTF